MERERTIALRLERDRLGHRLRRMELTISALRDRAVIRQSTMGAAPPPLRQAIASFEIEVVAVRRRLSELDRAAERARSGLVAPSCVDGDAAVTGVSSDGH
jgi:hypothetical protein